MICMILAITTGCKKSGSADDSSLATWGGKAYTFVELPGYFVEFFIDHGPDSPTSP